MGGDHGIPLVVAHSEEQVAPHDPRVVDQDVQAPEVLDDLGDRPCDLISPRDIAAQRDGFRTNVLHPLDRVPAAVLRQVKYSDLGPGLAQAYGLRSADPSSCAGDQGDALMQCNHSCSFLHTYHRDKEAVCCQAPQLFASVTYVHYTYTGCASTIHGVIVAMRSADNLHHTPSRV